MPHRRASLTTALLTATAVLAVGGCSRSGDADAKSAAHTGPSVLAPGKPGEANRTMSAEDAAEQREDDNSPNAADRSYARMMITHHTQALKMTELAPNRAESTQVKRIAERISAAQGPEISTMRSWLAANGKSGKGGTAHDHGTMPGMATDAQLTELRAAKGTSFDRLFLKLMIAHHQGAITMATDVKAQGNNIQIEEMADDVIAQQTSEIARMRDML